MNSNDVMRAETLDELCGTLNALRRELGETGSDTRLDEILDLSDLPQYGGVEPASTRGVWSWDPERLLVSAHDGSFEIVDLET